MVRTLLIATVVGLACAIAVPVVLVLWIYLSIPATTGGLASIGVAADVPLTAFVAGALLTIAVRMRQLRRKA